MARSFPLLLAAAVFLGGIRPSSLFGALRPVERPRPVRALAPRRVVDERLGFLELEEVKMPPSPQDGSGAVVSKVLEAGVRLLLRNYDAVVVAVGSRWETLLRGRVQAVQLSGKDWCTKLGLRARRLVVAALEGAALDYGELLQGRVTLTAVADGWAEAIFNEADFGQFLLYPQVAAASPTVEGAKFIFSSEGVIIDAAAETLTFEGRHAGHGLRGVLRCGQGGTVPTVKLEALGAQPEEALEPLEEALGGFFATLHVDLAGVDLRFRRLRFAPSHAAVLLKAEIRRIPNPFRDRI
ncbi:carA2 [Symbiodinium sp. CCMP2592]|nr:carA2 [Symbiodinium sp. CCMP2592]